MLKKSQNSTCHRGLMTRTVYVFYNENEKFLDNMEKLDI
jgi:hypothetical protein